MRTDIAGPGSESTTPTWESVEALVREKAQELIQQILEEEVTELLGRHRQESEQSEQKATVDPAPAPKATTSPIQALAQKAAAQELGGA